ncbi:hypothetical protein Cadr_000011360 [Camelus dromedarius]|uniref:Uncharacterized protein n=1 Tax=Camelus dromedarius TaxID=9838 RepID=A0A5N4DS14_CAMDR|nr:hypothetical protein Cadr_000011360 [Camelus dromedarius]
MLQSACITRPRWLRAARIRGAGARRGAGLLRPDRGLCAQAVLSGYKLNTLTPGLQHASHRTNRSSSALSLDLLPHLGSKWTPTAPAPLVAPAPAPPPAHAKTADAPPARRAAAPAARWAVPSAPRAASAKGRLTSAAAAPDARPRALRAALIRGARARQGRGLCTRAASSGYNQNTLAHGLQHASHQTSASASPVPLDLQSHLASRWTPTAPAPLVAPAPALAPAHAKTADAPPARRAAAPAAPRAVPSAPRAAPAKGRLTSAAAVPEVRETRLLHLCQLLLMQKLQMHLLQEKTDSEAAAPAALWAVPSAPRAASAKGRLTSAAAVPDVGETLSQM